MHVPFLHVALNDPGVLRAATHPARELLDELGALAVGWCPSADPDATSLKRISAIVTGLTRRSADKVSTSFDQALHELQRVIAARRRRIELAEQRAIESVIGHERLMLARSRVSTILDEELRDCEPVPWVRQLLRGPWAHHLVLTWLRHDESSSTFRAARDFVTALVWADSPPEQGARARHLAQLHAALPEQLRQGLTGITLHESEIARLVNQLEIFLACCLRGDDWPDFLFEIDPSLAGSEAMADWNEAAALDGPVPAQVDPLLLERLQDLPADTWVEFRDGPAARPERGRLCWTSPYTRRSLFVNWNGARLRHMPLHELALALKSGQTRLIDGSRLVARTLRALIQELRTSLATRPSS